MSLIAMSHLCLCREYNYINVPQAKQAYDICMRTGKLKVQLQQLSLCSLWCTEAIWVGWCISAYLFNVFYHDVLDLSNPTPYPVDRISVWVICKITHALLQHPAEFCVVLICHCILCCFWAVSTQELVPDIIQKSKWDSATQSLQKRYFNSKRKKKERERERERESESSTAIPLEDRPACGGSRTYCPWVSGMDCLPPLPCKQRQAHYV